MSTPPEDLLAYPIPLQFYDDSRLSSLWEVLQHRINVEPLNVITLAIFVLALIHTLIAPRILSLAHRLEHKYSDKKGAGPGFGIAVLHYFGEVEAIFGIWVIPLLIIITASKGWKITEEFVSRGLNFTEAIFVVIIMAIAASKPILKAAEQTLGFVAKIGGSSTASWWCSILIVGPLLGSLITEPAAMTICAVLLGKKFFELRPNITLQFATVGLLFVNISMGGLLTNFAAPPVLMVAGAWDWDINFMLFNFGWKALIAIVISTTLFRFVFAKSFKELPSPGTNLVQEKNDAIPFSITTVHLVFLIWTVFAAHTPVLLVFGFLLFLAFTEATSHYQDEVSLRSPLLVGFFLAGLIVHGKLQAWWIEPLLLRLQDATLFGGSILLTAFNDNAAITYLASLVPDLALDKRYLVVAGAVAGGGLTVIANAPNPAGFSILSRYFPDGISAVNLLLGALIPTLISAAILFFL